MATLTDYPDDWEETFLSNPNFSMVEYTRRVDEYQRLLKEKQDAADASGMSGGSEGAGVRSDQLYDSAGKPKGWGGGAFSPTEMSTGDPEEVAKTYDQWGNEVDMGNRKWGITLNKALPGIVNMIPGYNVVKSINDSINKNKNQTAATSTDDTGTTDTNVIPQNFNNMTGSMPNNISLLSPYNYGTNAVATPISAGNGGGLLDAATLEAINAAYDESTGGSSGGWTVG
jgi:hypothetical protein